MFEEYIVWCDFFQLFLKLLPLIWMTEKYMNHCTLHMRFELLASQGQKQNGGYMLNYLIEDNFIELVLLSSII